MQVTEYEYIRSDRIDRDDTTVIYEFHYSVTIEGTSYDYWGKDYDTKEFVFGNVKDHVFEGHIVVQVEREVEVFYDFEDENSFENAFIKKGKFEEASVSPRTEPPGELGFCSMCGKPLSIENDGGNGYCCDCALEYD